MNISVILLLLWLFRIPKSRKNATLSILLLMVDSNSDTYWITVINKFGFQIYHKIFQELFQYILILFQWKLIHNCIACATDCAADVLLQIMVNLSSLHVKSSPLPLKPHIIITLYSSLHFIQWILLTGKESEKSLICMFIKIFLCLPVLTSPQSTAAV